MTAIAEPLRDLMTSPGADLSMLTGTWLNTNEQSNGIVRMTAEDVDGVLVIHLFGAAENGSVDWGPANATVFFERNDEGMEQPFTARWEFDFMTVVAQGFLRQGVLVILSFTRFHDGSPRSDYFSKEFFSRV
jgi:hypothetical protein